MTNLQGEDMCTPTFPDDDKNSTQSSLPQYSDSQNSQNKGVSKKIQKSNNDKQLKAQKDQKSGQKVSCHQCGKKYTNKYSLQTHLKTLHKIKPHVCEVCPNVSFWELKDLKHHMEKNHLDYLIEQCRLQKEKEDAERRRKEMEEPQQQCQRNTENNQLQQQQYQNQHFNQNQQYQNQNFSQQQYQQQGKNMGNYNTFDMIIEQEENSSSTQTSNGNNQNNGNQQSQNQLLDFENMYPFEGNQQNYYNSEKIQQNNDSLFNNNQEQNKNQYAVPQNPILYRTNSSQLTKEGMQNRVMYLQNKMKVYMQNKNIDNLKKIQNEINYLINCIKTKNYLPSKQQQQPNYQVKQNVNHNNNNMNFAQDVNNIDDFLRTSESPRNLNNNHHNNQFYNNNNNSNELLHNNNNLSNTDCFLGDSEFNDQLQFENFIYE